MRNIRIIITALMISSAFVSCEAKHHEDNKENTVEFEVENVKWTSGEKEQEQDSLILDEVNRFIHNNKSDAVLNYWFLCDSNMIAVNGDYEVNHKANNVSIGLGKKNVRLTPIPSSYKIDEGPIATYKINNDSLGNFSSYFLDLELDENYKVITFKATLRFTKEKDGGNILSFMKEIGPNDQYSLEEKLKNNNW